MEFENIYSKKVFRMKENKETVIQCINTLLMGEGSEVEQSEKINYIIENTFDPQVSNLIFWDDRRLTAEEIYDVAMSYKAIIL